MIGFAKAETPLLAKPLEGPVYFRSAPENKSGLPDIVAALKGQIDISLDGKIKTVFQKLHGEKVPRIRTTFEAVPDAPVSKFTLSLDGGNKGLLQNSTNLCKAPLRVNVKMAGQNGKTTNENPLLATPCGEKQQAARSTKPTPMKHCSPRLSSQIEPRTAPGAGLQPRPAGLLPLLVAVATMLAFTASPAGATQIHPRFNTSFLPKDRLPPTPIRLQIRQISPPRQLARCISKHDVYVTDHRKPPRREVHSSGISPHVRQGRRQDRRSKPTAPKPARCLHQALRQHLPGGHRGHFAPGALQPTPARRLSLPSTTPPAAHRRRLRRRPVRQPRLQV